MNPPVWLLRRRLRRAARLLRKGAINEWQYSALAVDLGYQIMNRDLRSGTKIDYLSFGVELSNYLVRDVGNRDEIARSRVVYGPYNEATVRLFPGPRPAHLWDQDLENKAARAALYLSPFHRAAFWVQGWWDQQEQLFPVFTKLTVFILGLIIGGVFVWLTG